MRILLPLLVLPLALAFLFCASCPAAAAAGPRPNVIVFLVDDMGWMDSTPYGSQYYQTPNIERLAQRGMLFSDAYACPLCSPTRASILSGQYSARHGILSATGHRPPQAPDHVFLPDRAGPNQRIITPESKNYLEPSQYTLAEALRDAGYRTAHLGKWHLGLTEPHWPDKQGFEVTFHGKPDPGPGSYFSPYSFKQYQSFPDGPPGEYITDRLTDEALKFIEESRDRPFYLNLWHYGVHGPWGHKEEITKTFVGRKDPRGEQGNPIMASMLKSIDESLGRLLDKLEALKLADRTVFFFTSDNGGNTHSNTPDDRKTAAREKGPRSDQLADWRKWAGDLPPTNNAPLRMGKGTLFEGGTRVPLIIAWPGHVPPATRTAAIVGQIDLYPTVLDLLGVAANPAQKIDGVSFAPVLRDPQAKLAREALFNFFPSGGPSKPGGVWVRQGDWKLIRWFETGPDYPETYELYNLRDDVGESKNLANAMPDRVRQLDALIEQFFKDTGALVPKPNPDYRPTTKPAAKTAAKPARPLGGWVPKSCSATVQDGALVVTGEGKSPFLGISSLKHDGPVTLRLRARSTGGPAKVAWRTSDQEKFPDSGQEVEFSLPAGTEFIETGVELPVKGSLLHMRLFLPAQSQPVAIEWIELRPAKGKPQRWQFKVGGE